jgi:hypothetical protein
LAINYFQAIIVKLFMTATELLAHRCELLAELFLQQFNPVFFGKVTSHDLPFDGWITANGGSGGKNESPG